jgi:hypothetical protein
VERDTAGSTNKRLQNTKEITTGSKSSQSNIKRRPEDVLLETVAEPNTVYY